MLLYHFSITGQLVFNQFRVTSWKMQMRKKSHCVRLIQSILIIISRIDRNVKKCEIYQGKKSNQTNQVQVHPSISGCVSAGKAWKLCIWYFCLVKGKHEPNTDLISILTSLLTWSNSLQRLPTKSWHARQNFKKINAK